MADSIRHRGPDDEGFYISGPIGLGFRRLSIIDLSGGHQPLSNEDGTVWIVFNGEIYNYKDLRADLVNRGHQFRTKSDTEVIVHLYEDFGTACVEKLRGMFAFAIWDENRRRLFLARDRVGIKPLYYYLGKDAVSFASELKAILADPSVSRHIDPAMIDRFLTYRYLPGQNTLLRGVLKLAPGHTLLIENGQIKIQPYWDLQFHEPAASDPDPRLEEQLVTLLDEAVQLHMISDVPVGVLLSGGVDSTALLSFAADKTESAINTFTIGFSAPGVDDERPFAELAAKQFGSKHYSASISAEDFASFLPEYVWHMEEPVCEPPAVALYYISKLARQYVKVLISGEGGDEAFAGYQNYRNTLWFERFKGLLGPLQNPTSDWMMLLGRTLQSRVLNKYGPRVRASFDDYYLSRTASPFDYFSTQRQEVYSKDMLARIDEAQIDNVTKKFLCNANQYSLLNKMLYVDTKTWLPDDLLIKADKMTMANSVELRVPLLDHKVLEFAASLPANQKVRYLTTKYLAKRALRSRVPKAILNRRKAGFPVPYEGWLRGALATWMREILLDRRTIQRGYFKSRALEQLIRANSDSGQYSKELFSLVVLELWHRTFADDRRSLHSQKIEVILSTQCGSTATQTLGVA